MKDGKRIMLTHEEMVGLQAEKHELIDGKSFRSNEEYVLHLMHQSAYVQASTMVTGKSVLDLGCNTGYGTQILAESARRAVGVDVSHEAISAARQHYVDAGIEFQLIDGERLPFADGEFDVIISCQVLEHIVDYTIYFGELKRVLSQGGIAVLTTPNSVLRLDPGMKPWNPFHVREFTHLQLRSLLENYFSSVQVSGLFAEEELYETEKNRVTRAREAARAKQKRWSDPFRSLAKKVLTESVLARVRAMRASGPIRAKEFDTTFVERFGVGDFFYRADGLGQALDFMAICAGKLLAKELPQEFTSSDRD